MVAAHSIIVVDHSHTIEKHCTWGASIIPMLKEIKIKIYIVEDDTP